MDDPYKPPLEPWWTPRRLFYLGALIIGALFTVRIGSSRSIDLTPLLTWLHDLARPLLGH
jgi:hypothetical protein